MTPYSTIPKTERVSSLERGRGMDALGAPLSSGERGLVGALREGCGGRPEGAVSPQARRSVSEPRSQPDPSAARGTPKKNPELGLCVIPFCRPHIINLLPLL